MKLVRIATILGSAAILLALTAPASAASPRNSGFYDNQIIEYEVTGATADSPQDAALIAQGNIVFHIVDASGSVPAAQVARLKAAFPNGTTVGGMAVDTNNGNVLNFVPREPGYTGGAWNLQIVHWNTGVTPRELSSDHDIFAARDLGEVTIEVTATVVRCPFVNFANVRSAG